jgi:hypothetical protein
MSILPALVGVLKQTSELEASLSYTARPWAGRVAQW